MVLESKKLREQAGRDSFSRYRAQVRSAAIAALSILDGGEVDRVYCDLHDDFVVRRKIDNNYFYIFYQVKTHGKENHNWTINEVLGLNTRIKDQSKQNSEKIKNSFAGKMLLHTVNFGDSCRAVIFQTNIHIEDKLSEVLQDIEDGKFENAYTNVVLERFNECFVSSHDEDIASNEIRGNLSKIKIETDVQYLKLKEDDFEPTAKEYVYKYSEVDLGRDEAKEILLKLLALVSEKSSGVIDNITADSIEKFAGISINDLLEILSISKDAYFSLIEGGDSKAIKSASIIQRTLMLGGANVDTVNYCSRCKTQWDNWIRLNRHNIPELKIHTLISKVRHILNSVIIGNSLDFSSLHKPLIDLQKDVCATELLIDLTEDELLGCVFSELVRDKS